MRQLAGTLRVERVVSLDVVRYLKGSGEPTVHLRVPGGTLGRYRTVTAGAPELADGEEGVFFLHGAAGSGPRLVGLGQGLHRVIRDEATGHRRVHAPVLSSGDGPIRRGDPLRRAMTLEEFEGRLAATLIAQRARRGAAR